MIDLFLMFHDEGLRHKLRARTHKTKKKKKRKKEGKRSLEWRVF